MNGSDLVHISEVRNNLFLLSNLLRSMLAACYHLLTILVRLSTSIVHSSVDSDYEIFVDIYRTVCWHGRARVDSHVLGSFVWKQRTESGPWAQEVVKNRILHHHQTCIIKTGWRRRTPGARSAVWRRLRKWKAWTRGAKPWLPSEFWLSSRNEERKHWRRRKLRKSDAKTSGEGWDSSWEYSICLRTKYLQMTLPWTECWNWKENSVISSHTILLQIQVLFVRKENRLLKKLSQLDYNINWVELIFAESYNLVNWQPPKSSKSFNKSILNVIISQVMWQLNQRRMHSDIKPRSRSHSKDNSDFDWKLVTL